MSSRQRVLVCDDEPQILRALRVILRDAGFEVDPASTATEALDHAAVRPPHAAIIDLVLPDGDGIEVCRQLREWTAIIGAEHVKADGATRNYYGRTTGLTAHRPLGVLYPQTTARVQTYVESATWSRQERGGSAVSFIDYGVIAALRPRLLVDAGAFAGVTASAPNWGVFSGVSFAFAGRDVHKQLRRGARADRQRPVFRTQYN